MSPRIVRVILCIVTIKLFLIVLFLLAAVIPSKITVESFRKYQTFFINLSEKGFVTSSFRTAYPDLERIDVLFKNPNLESRDELVISLSKVGGGEIVSKQFSGFNLGDTSHARVDIPKNMVAVGEETKVEVRLTKLVDGKLMMGTKNDEINFIQYYDSNSRRAIGTRFISIFDKVISQPMVVILPMIVGIVSVW